MPSYSKKVTLKGKSAQVLYDFMSVELEKFLNKTPVGKTEVKLFPESKRLEASSSMFSATLLCQEECLQLDVKLGLLAAPFRGKLDEAIDRWLAKHFSDALVKN